MMAMTTAMETSMPRTKPNTPPSARSKKESPAAFMKRFKNMSDQPADHQYAEEHNQEANEIGDRRAN